MSKITTDLSSLPTNEAMQSVQQASNEFTNFMSAPVRKLDADEYMANDLDGVTEGLTGSGNLNFLMMQAGQTDEEMSSSNPFDLQGGGDLFAPASLLNAASNTSGPASSYKDTAMDRPFEMPNGLGSLAESAVGQGNSNGTLGGLGASQLASNTTSATPFSDTESLSSLLSSTGTNGNNGNSGTSGISGVDGTNGNGNNGTNGTDGTPGGNTFVTENTFIDLGDTYEFIDDITNEYTDFLTELTENTFSTVNNTTDILNETINNIFGGNPLDIGPIGISLDSVLDDMTGLNLDVINGDTVTNVLNEAVNLAPALQPVTDIVGDVFGSMSLDAILDPFQYDNDPDDSDLNIGTGLDVLGLQLPPLGLDVPLDPLEMLVGDIDIGLDAAEELLDLPEGLPDLPLLSGGSDDTDLALSGLETVADVNGLGDLVETVMNPVEDLVGDFDIGAGLGIDLLGVGNTDDTGADNDISLPVDIEFIDSALLNDAVEIGLDPLENIIGDVDLDLGIAGNLLGDVAAPMFDSEEGGLGMETPLSELGDSLADIGSDAVPLLPEPLSLDDLNGPDGILGLIDSTLDTAIDIVDAIPENTGGLDLGAITGGGDSSLPDVTSDIGSWTETVLPDAGSLLGGGLTSDPIGSIPDPIAAAPILSLPVVPVLPSVPVVGGLFGGGNHGGLFG